MEEHIDKSQSGPRVDYTVINTADVTNNVTDVVNVDYVVMAEAVRLDQTTENKQHVGSACGTCDFIIALCYILFVTVKCVIPIVGQWHAIHILKNWDEYIDEEGKGMANYELVCASYGIYLVWLILKYLWNNLGGQIRKFYDGSWNRFVQLDDTTKQNLGCSNGPICFIRNGGHLKHQNNTINECYAVPADVLYDRTYDIFDHFIGLLGLTIISFGIFTIPLIYLDLFHFGNKFIKQYKSLVKYFFGHCFKLITNFVVFHIIPFSVTNFNANRPIDRILSRSFFGITLVPYIIYCYFWYAFDWRWGYENRVRTLKIFNEALSKSATNETPKKILDGEMYTPYTLWICGTIMLTFGTFGTYWLFHLGYIIIDNLKLTFCEICLSVFSGGLYIIGKLWYKFVTYLYNERYECSNTFNKIVLEISLFVCTLGCDYLNEMIINIRCFHGSKRYSIGALQTLVFFPFFFASYQNPWIRIPSKLILIAYNVVVYYFIIVASNYSYIAIIVLVIINYPMYCVLRTFTTNKTILDAYNNTKHYVSEQTRFVKYWFYYMKKSCKNRWIITKNTIKESISRIKTNVRESSANFYNWRRNLRQGDPNFKTGKISVPKISQLKEIKTEEQYFQTYIQNRNEKKPIKNTIKLLKCLMYKLKSEFNKKLNVYDIYEEKTWSERYDEMTDVNKNDVYIMDYLKDRVVRYVANIIAEINELNFDKYNDKKSRKAEIYSVYSFNNKKRVTADIIKHLIIRLSKFGSDNIDDVKRQLDSILPPPLEAIAINV